MRNQSDSKKKKRVFANHDDLEQVQRQISEMDADFIFGKSVFPFVDEQEKLNLID